MVQGCCASCNHMIDLKLRGLGTILCPSCEAVWYNTKFRMMVELYRELVKSESQKGAPDIPTTV